MGCGNRFLFVRAGRQMGRAFAPTLQVKRNPPSQLTSRHTQWFASVLRPCRTMRGPSTFGKKMTTVSAHRAMAGEVDQWAVVQKTEFGWDMLDSKAKREMRLQGINPDTW